MRKQAGQRIRPSGDVFLAEIMLGFPIVLLCAEFEVQDSR